MARTTIAAPSSRYLLAPPRTATSARSRCSPQDLQLGPAFALPDYEPILRAIDLAYERDFSFIPVLSRSRKLLGYIDVSALKKDFEAGKTNPVRLFFAAELGAHATRLGRRDTRPYDAL